MSAESDEFYRFYDLDPSGYSTTSSFTIVFDAYMGGNNAALHIDDIQAVD